jgi:hypothetical protein
VKSVCNRNIHLSEGALNVTMFCMNVDNMLVLSLLTVHGLHMVSMFVVVLTS